LTKFQIGDIVKGEDDGQIVYGYVLRYTDTNPKDSYLMVRWFDGCEDTNSRAEALRKVTNLGELDRTEDW
jgi:hypothetical protein